MDKQVNDLLDQGIIEHSTPPWGAPALLVDKPDGSYRFVVGYRDLNHVTRVDPYPVPNSSRDAVRARLRQVFHSRGYGFRLWQIEMHEKYREKTAFNTPSGHY